jgi:hypothetical protein
MPRAVSCSVSFDRDGAAFLPGANALSLEHVQAIGDISGPCVDVQRRVNLGRWSQKCHLPSMMHTSLRDFRLSRDRLINNHQVQLGAVK